MATIDLTITTGKGEKSESHTYTIDPLDVPLALVEASEDGKFGMLRQAIADFLDLPDNISRQLTVRHVKQISEAISEASKIPNG